MRLWSIHPKYLDTKGLLAVWREGLLAKKVLEGKTKGYRNHPQLIRFKKYHNTLYAINAYLSKIYDEACNRSYNFSKNKINYILKKNIIPVSNGQIKYERKHLLKKLKLRDIEKYEELFSYNDKNIEINSIFYLIDGDIEEWEKLN